MYPGIEWNWLVISFLVGALAYIYFSGNQWIDFDFLVIFSQHLNKIKQKHNQKFPRNKFALNFSFFWSYKPKSKIIDKIKQLLINLLKTYLHLYILIFKRLYAFLFTVYIPYIQLSYVPIFLYLYMSVF